MASSFDFIDMDFRAALPSIYVLGMYVFVPWAARRSLYYWRAIQVYERQEKISEKPDAKAEKLSKIGLIITIILAFTVVALFIAFIATSGYNWKEKMPVVAHIRHVVPTFILTCAIMVRVMSLVEKERKPLTMVFRQQAEYHGRPSFYQDIDCASVESEQASYKVRILNRINKVHPVSLFVSVAVLSLAIIWTADLISEQAPLYLATLVGALWAIDQFHQTAVCHQYKSFQYMAAIPLLAIILTIVFFLLGFLLICLITLIGWFFTNIVGIGKNWSIKDKVDSWKPETDLEFTQFIALFYAIHLQFVAVIPTVMVCLAYRFDATRAGLDKVNDDDADEIIKATTKAVDNFGRRPISTGAVSIPSSILAQTSFPTFNAAYATLLLVQLVGVFVDAGTRWQGRLEYPTIATQLPVKGDQIIAISPWPLLAQIIVSLAMVISAYIRGNGCLKSLWQYGEQWTPKSYSSKASDTLDPAEADDLEKAETSPALEFKEKDVTEEFPLLKDDDCAKLSEKA